MATSYFEILEVRGKLFPEHSEIYIKISDADDGTPVGGWYKKTIGVAEPILPALDEAITKCNYLHWDRGEPK